VARQAERQVKQVCPRTPGARGGGSAAGSRKNSSRWQHEQSQVWVAAGKVRQAGGKYGVGLSVGGGGARKCSGRVLTAGRTS